MFDKICREGGAGVIRVVVDGTIFRGTPCGGIARYWTETLQILARRTDAVRLTVVVPPGTVRSALDAPVHVSGHPGAFWAAWRADLFHSTFYTRWPRFRRPSIVTVYDLIDAECPENPPNGAAFVERQLAAIRQASAVLAISQATADLVQAWCGTPAERLLLASPGVSAPFSDPLPEDDECRRFRQQHAAGAPFLLHVGRRRSYKNFAVLLKAFRAATHRTDRHLLVVGGPSAWAADERKLIEECRLHDRVHLLPSADDALLRLAYAAADALVHASRMEGFGIPVIEALACGTGLILSDIPVYREIASGRAVFVPVDDVDAWAQAMASAVPYRREWRDAVLAQYTWDAAAEAHLRAYRLALEQTAGDA